MSTRTQKSQAGADPKGFKATISEVPLRLYLSKIKTSGIISYDFDNCYPDRMKIISDGSVVAKRCKLLRSKYVFGKGFSDELFKKTLLNDKETADQVLKKCVNNVSDYEGIALWVGYNALMEVSSIKHLPFNYVRLTDPDGDNPDKYAVHPDWCGLKSKKFDPGLIDYIDKYSSDKDVIKNQIEKAEGFDNWRGQVLWMPLTMEDEYPETIYDSAFHSISTDVEIDLFKYRNVSTSFLAYYFYYKYGVFESDEARDEFVKSLGDVQGGRKAGKVLLVEGQTKETRDELVKIDVNNNDKLFTYHEESVNKKIRVSFSIPPELLGLDSSSGFDSERVDQARAYYNSITQDERDTIKMIFELVLNNADPAIMGAGNYQIDKLVFEQDETQKITVKKKKKK
jgi:hypothetical protein